MFASPWPESPTDRAVMFDEFAPATPDVVSAIGRLRYPGREGAVVRLTAAMLGTDFMTAYPWSREHGWSAAN